METGLTYLTATQVRLRYPRAYGDLSSQYKALLVKALLLHRCRIDDGGALSSELSSDHRTRASMPSAPTMSFAFSAIVDEAGRKSAWHQKWVTTCG